MHRLLLSAALALVPLAAQFPAAPAAAQSPRNFHRYNVLQLRLMGPWAEPGQADPSRGGQVYIGEAEHGMLSLVFVAGRQRLWTAKLAAEANGRSVRGRWVANHDKNIDGEITATIADDGQLVIASVPDSATATQWASQNHRYITQSLKTGRFKPWQRVNGAIWSMPALGQWFSEFGPLTVENDWSARFTAVQSRRNADGTIRPWRRIALFLDTAEMRNGVDTFMTSGAWELIADPSQGGRAHFTFDRNGKSFTGSLVSDHSEPWNGTRTAPAAPPAPLPQPAPQPPTPTPEPAPAEPKPSTGQAQSALLDRFIGGWDMQGTPVRIARQGEGVIVEVLGANSQRVFHRIPMSVAPSGDSLAGVDRGLSGPGPHPFRLSLRSGDTDIDAHSSEGGGRLLWTARRAAGSGSAEQPAPAPAPVPPAPAPAPPPVTPPPPAPAPAPAPAPSVEVAGFKPLRQFDVRLDRLWEARGYPTRQVHAFVTIRNISARPQYITSGFLKAVLTDGDGVAQERNQVWRASSEPATLFNATPVVQPGAELRLRYVFHPDEGSRPVTLTLSEGDARAEFRAGVLR